MQEPKGAVGMVNGFRWEFTSDVVDHCKAIVAKTNVEDKAEVRIVLDGEEHDFTFDDFFKRLDI